MNSDVIAVSSLGTALFRGKEYHCSLGKGGIKTDKHEGDGTTPLGEFPIREIYYRGDRVEKPESPFTTTEISLDDGWSSEVTDKLYNTHITLPYSGSHEKLFREDGIYNIIVVLGYNDTPSVAGKGSAIFIHITRPDFTPTEGCIAFTENDLREILSRCTKETTVQITASSLSM